MNTFETRTPLAIVLVIAFIVAMVMVYKLRPFTPSVPEADLPGTPALDCPPGAASCPAALQIGPPVPSPPRAFGHDAREVGQLLDPVRARVRVYPAAGGPTREETAEAPAGMWLVPKQAMAPPW